MGMQNNHFNSYPVIPAENARDFKIYFKNGSVLETRSLVYIKKHITNNTFSIGLKDTSYIIKDYGNIFKKDENRIFTSQIDSIFLLDYPKPTPLSGFNDSLPLQKHNTRLTRIEILENLILIPKVSGPLSLYETGDSKNSKILKDENGNFSVFSPSELTRLLKDDKVASDFYRSRNNGLLIGVGMGIAGVVLFFQGISSINDSEKESTDPYGSSKKEVSLSPSIFIGGGLILGSQIPRFFYKDRDIKSIELYNKNKKT